MPVYKRGIKPFGSSPAFASQATCEREIMVASPRPQVRGVERSIEPPQPVHTKTIYIHPRVNHVWVDIQNRYPPLAGEAGLVLALFPGCTRVIRVTGGGVPVGYRRWEVR